MTQVKRIPEDYVEAGGYDCPKCGWEPPFTANWKDPYLAEFEFIRTKPREWGEEGLFD